MIVSETLSCAVDEPAKAGRGSMPTAASKRMAVVSRRFRRSRHNPPMAFASVIGKLQKAPRQDKFLIKICPEPKMLNAGRPALKPGPGYAGKLKPMALSAASVRCTAGRAIIRW